MYKATVNGESYIGIAGGQFKQRYNNHTASFRNPDKKHETKLSKFVWELKEKAIDPVVKWEIVETVPTYTPTLGRCILCLKEKERILFYKEEATLNCRSELVSNCRHRRKFLLL